MDDKLSRSVTETFVKLYEQGLIYRGKRLVNWDPVLHRPCPDLEVENEKKDGSRWHIRLPGWPTVPGTSPWPPPAPRPCWATWP